MAHQRPPRYLEVRPLGEQEGCGSVAQVVEPDLWQPEFFEELASNAATLSHCKVGMIRKL